MLCIICLQGNKTTMRHLLEWPESRTLTTPSASKDVKRRGRSFITGGNAKMVQPLWKTVF